MGYIQMDLQGRPTLNTNNSEVELQPSAITYIISFDNPGSYTWECPSNVNTIKVGVWGAGGKGGSITTTYSMSGKGAGGGGFSFDLAYPVQSGITYNIIVGTGATTGVAAGQSSFDTITAYGGESVANNDDISYIPVYGGKGTYPGGRGANGVLGSYSGGGGSSASWADGGGNASTYNGGVAPDEYGGNGADGITTYPGLYNGNPGYFPGGGGSGSMKGFGSTDVFGGDGGNGKVEITYTIYV